MYKVQFTLNVETVARRSVAEDTQGVQQLILEKAARINCCPELNKLKVI